MSNVVPLHSRRRWRAVVEYRTSGKRSKLVEHFFEELWELSALIECGPSLTHLLRCTLTLNRPGHREESSDACLPAQEGHSEKVVYPRF